MISISQSREDELEIDKINKHAQNKSYEKIIKHQVNTAKFLTNSQ